MAYGDPDDDLDAFIAAVDRALTAQFGPNHQEMFEAAGPVVSRFAWGDGGTGCITPTRRTGPP